MTSQPPPGAWPIWGGFSNSASNASRSTSGPQGASPPLEPLARRLLVLAALLSVLLIGVVLNWALRSPDNPFNPVAAAAVRTQRTAGARMAIVTRYSSSASTRTVTATGSGVYNARTGRSQMSMTLPGTLRRERIVAVGDEHTSYVRSPRISKGLPPGRGWLAYQPLLGHSESTVLAGGGAHNELELLRAVGDVESLGEEDVRGVATQRYRATITLSRFAERVAGDGEASLAREYRALAKEMPAAIPTEVWIDAGGLVRAERTVMTLPNDDGGPQITMDMRIDLFDFGISPKVKLPPAREVFDATPLLRAELNLLDGESAKRFIAPAGEPLQASAYRRRSLAICVGIERRIGQLEQRAAPERAAFERFARDGGAGSHSSQQTLQMFRKISYAYYEPALGAVERGFRRLGRLAPPASRASAFRRFIRQAVIYIEIDRAETRAVEVGQMKLAESLSKRLRSMSGSIERATRGAGLPSVCAAHDESGSRSSSATGASDQPKSDRQPRSPHPPRSEKPAPGAHNDPHASATPDYGHFDSPLAGRWSATGTVLSAVHLAGQPRGTVLKRPWAFKKVCKPTGCRTLFLRETLYGPSITTLVPHHGFYTAAFPPVAVPCTGPQGTTPGRPGRLHDTYRLGWSTDHQRLLAIEHQIGPPSRGCGPRSTQTTRWSATR